jgi:hypothetical protein
MSARIWSAGEGAGDPGDALFLDRAERAESDWVLARDSDPHAPAPSSKIASDYAELEELLGDLPAGPADQGWQDEVLRTVAASASPSPSRSWRRRVIARWTMRAALAAAVVVAVAAWPLWPGPDDGELEVAILHVDRTRSDLEEVVVGDHLIARAQPGHAGDLRVFRAGGALMARCPDGPACTASGHGEYAIEIALDAPVRYQVILVIGMIDAPPGETMDAYLDRARAASAHIILYPPIDVH